LQEHCGFSEFTNTACLVDLDGKRALLSENQEDVDLQAEDKEGEHVQFGEVKDCVLSCIRYLAPKGVRVFRLRSKGFFIAPNESGMATDDVPGPYEVSPDDENWIVHGVKDEEHLLSLTSQEADVIRRFALERLEMSPQNLKWAVAMGIGSDIWSHKKRKFNELSS